MNVTAVETLERRLKATRDAMAGELDRARNAAREAAKAEARAADYQPIIRDLEAAIDELHSLLPTPEPAPVEGQPGAADALGKIRRTARYVAETDEHVITGEQLRVIEKEHGIPFLPFAGAIAKPFDVPCPSCQARAGDPCRSPTGETIEPHATRRAPA